MGLKQQEAIPLLCNNLSLALAYPISVCIASTTDNFNIPLKPRYYQFGTAIKAGETNNTAIFTMTYQ